MSLEDWNPQEIHRSPVEPAGNSRNTLRNPVYLFISFFCVCVCVKPCLLRAKNVVRCSVSCFLLKQGAAGLSLRLRPTKTVIDRCVNVPARDAPGRNGRSWGSHMNPPLNSCINVGLSGRWAHDAHVWFFRTCRMRLDDAVGDLLTSWGRIQVCFGQILSKSWS